MKCQTQWPKHIEKQRQSTDNTALDASLWCLCLFRGESPHATISAHVTELASHLLEKESQAAPFAVTSHTDAARPKHSPLGAIVP